MINITDLKQEQKISPILRLGFRPFFLFGSLFGFLAIAIWALSLNSVISFTPFNNLLWWHSHEMLFGFVAAIVAGFLLTAVQTWTSIPSIKGTKLLCLFILWLAARLLLAFAPDINVFIIMAIDIAFIPLAAAFLAWPILKIKQYRNLIFIPILALMTLANIMTYLPSLGYKTSFNQQAIYGTVLIITFLVAFLGGRVIPMFTANGTKTEKVPPKKWLEISALFSLFLVFVFFFTNNTQHNVLLTYLCFLSAVLHTIRQLRWRPWVTLQVPLVWSLHFTMMFIPIGLFMLCLHFKFNIVSISVAMHSLTIGVIGGMIMAMMSRVSLGHTGRQLKVHWLMRFAFASIILSAFARGIVVAMWPELSVNLWSVSAALWCFSFICFLAIYAPILSAPRADGRPG